MKRLGFLICGIIIAGFAMMFALSGCELDGGPDASYDSLTVDRDTVMIKDTVEATAHVSGEEKDEVQYSWDADAGEFIDEYPESRMEQWVAPDSSGIYQIKCTVTLGVPNYITKTAEVVVIEEE